MADISAIKLPNNTTLNLKDASALKQLEFADHSLVALTRAGTSTTIDLGEFDTLSVTDLNAGNLVTTGVGRFTNGLYGNLTGDVTGSAGSVTNNLKIQLNGGTTEGTNQFTYNGSAVKNINITKTSIGLGNVDNTADANKAVLTATKFASAQSVTLTGDTTGTASSQAGWSIATTTDRISTIGDYRTVATTPNSYANKIIFQGLKTNGYIGSPSTSTYSYLIGLRGWADASGGDAHELAFNNSGIYRRNGATTTWGNWLKILDSGNYTDYTVTKTGTGASGTWGISITGNAATATSATSATSATTATNATKATQDSDGNAINTTYMKKSGGTFTGAVTLNADPTANLHAATKQYVDTQLASGIAASDAMVFKGTMGTGGTATSLPTSNVVVGDTYKAISAITVAAASSWTGSEVSAKSGDLIVAMANTPKWIVVPSGDEIVTTVKYSTTTQNLTTSAQSGAITVGEAATKQVVTSIDATANLPTANAVKTFVENKGYVTSSGVTSVATGVGLTGGTITGTGTIKAKLKSETNATYDSASVTNTSSRQYAVVPDKSGYLSVNVPWTAYSSGTGISVSNGVINHSNAVTAGTAGTSSATSGPTIAIPYVTYDAQGHVTAVGTHTHTVNGALSVTSLSASSYVAVNSGNAGNAGGLALYSTSPTTFGITMRQTSNQGKHGYVQGDWAIYNHMSGAVNRGFVWKLDSNSIASISGSGSAVFNGSVTVGGNAGNTSGCRMEFDSTLKCVNWIFN